MIISVMDYMSNPIIVVGSGLEKEASIYFDRIAPIFIQNVPEKILKTIGLPKEFWDAWRNENYYIAFSFNARQLPEEEEERLLDGLIDDDYDYDYEKGIWIKKDQWWDKYYVCPLTRSFNLTGVPAIPLFASERSYEVCNKTTVDVIESKLVNARLINPDTLEWDQVYEVRKDTESVNKMRNLRLYMYDNFDGKNIDYIRDAIAKRIEDHDAACKKHGIELREAIFSSLIDAKSSLGWIVLAAASLISGHTYIAGASGVLGASLQIGKAVLKINSKKQGFNISKNTHELAYIIKLQKKINKNIKNSV